MNEKMKKWLGITGLVVICVVLIFAISKVLYHEPAPKMQVVESEPEDGDVIIGTWSSEQVLTENEKIDMDTGTEEEAETEIEQETEKPQEPKEEVKLESEVSVQIEVESEAAVSDKEQAIQPDPQKTEDKKPQEPPALAEDADTKNPNTTPSYEEPQKEENSSAPADSAPSNGVVKDDMIYIDGFGWIPNEGGGGSGTVADNMYENGNKIGIMD